ncbi:unnamed protein product, partial [Protopolystoma xenopodis]
MLDLLFSDIAALRSASSMIPLTRWCHEPAGLSRSTGLARRQVSATTGPPSAHLSSRHRGVPEPTEHRDSTHIRTVRLTSHPSAAVTRRPPLSSHDSRQHRTLPVHETGT